MAKQFLADTVDITGHAYPTVGENIRKGAKDPSTIISAFTDDTDKAKMTDALNVSSEDLKNAVVAMLSGERFHFGSLDAEPLTSEQVTKIKTFLGIV
jgi:hypothetical protein